MTSSRHFLAPYIWLNAENSGAWAHNVLLKVGMSGCWQAIDTRPSAAAMQPATLLPGTVLPSIVNAHSHAFQRAFAGMSETRVNDSDHFWSWRDRMYGVANRITPEQMQTIAAQLYCFTICAASALGQVPTAQRLFQAAHAGGAVAAGCNCAGFYSKHA